MTEQQILTLLETYEKQLQNVNIEAIEADHNMSMQVYWRDARRTSLQHALTMIPEMHTFLAAGKTEKVMRWLGFIQAILWMNGIHTLSALRSHNRS